MNKDLVGPLHRAVMRQSLSEVTAALSEGANVDELDREDRTPLFYASMDGLVSIVLELIRRGANPNARDKHSSTPLHFAAQEYRFAAAEILLQSGAEVDPKDDYGNTPLSRAVYESKGRGDMILLLLRCGAERSSMNNYGVSPQAFVRTIGNYDVARFFDTN